MTEQVDVVVIGLGPGGEDVAGRLAEAGLSVVGVEERLVGGECPYFGCVPSKMIIRGANALEEARRVSQLSGAATVEPDFGPVATRIRDEATDDWNDQVAVDRLVGKGAAFARGTGRLTGPRQVVVTGPDGSTTEYEARRGVVVNTGTAPAVPPIDGLADTPYWTNRDILKATEAPASLIVLGGGAIGLELAQAFHRFGSEVTVVEVGDRILAVEEPESSALLQEVFEREGIAIRCGAPVSSVTHDGTAFSLVVGDDTVTAERLLVAAGRRPNLASLGLDAVGLDPSARSVPVDDWMRAGDGLWVVGDIAGKGAFTHVSMYHADVVVRDVLGRGGPAADHRALPRVTFTDPEIGATGMTEKQARDAGLTVRTAISQLPSSSRGWIHKAGNDGFIKLVMDADRGILVGATSAGPMGGEVLSALVVAVHAEVSVSSLRHMIYAYPTFHRAIEDAVKQLD